MDDQAGQAEVLQPVRDFAEKLAREQGAAAVLFYGSNLRTGSLEGVLDFYLLLPGAPDKGLWPRVSYREWVADGVPLRAKIATMQLETFCAAAAGDLVDTTIWARFVQPSRLIWAKDEASAEQVAQAVADASATAARLAAALGPVSGEPDDYWRALFRATYQAELRVEPKGREDSILSVNARHFEGLLPVALKRAGVAFTQDGASIRPQMSDAERARVLGWWDKRRKLGKAYNVIRLIRATTTFDGAARYGAWKLHRHTGISVKLTPFREKHPLLAAPKVAWEIWRARKQKA